MTNKFHYLKSYLLLRNRNQCPSGHVCRNRRRFKSCDRSGNCKSPNLECTRGICRLNDGCGGQIIDCFGGNEYCEDGYVVMQYFIIKDKVFLQQGLN